MATIKKVKSSVGAPDLTRNLQNINIPRDAFGANVGAELVNLGGTVADSANRLNLAFGRMEERRSTTDASNAFKDVPISEFNALEQAKQNPGDLATFQQRQTKEFDDRMKALREGLSERARLKFDQKVLSTRTSLAKNAVTWARGQEIVQGRNAMNSEIQNSIAVAPGDLLNLGQHRQDIVDIINQAFASGSLVAVGRQKPIDPADLIASSLRAMDKEIANSLVFDNPESLKQMLDNGALGNLTEQDERIFRSLANSSSANIVERRTITTRDAYFSKNQEFSKKFHDNILTWAEANNEQASLQPLVDAGDEDAKKQQAMIIKIRDRLIKPEEQKQTQATQAAIRRITATKEAKEALGISKGEKPSKRAQGAKYVELTNRFLDFGGKKITTRGAKKGQFIIKDASVRLSDLLDFQNDIEDALDAGLITLSQHNAWQTKLMPTLRSKIESKHFEERKGFVGIGQRDPDIYSDGFSHVLETLKGTEFDTSANQAEALASVFRIAEGLNINAEEDPIKRKELLQSVGQRAVNELYRSVIPEINNLTDDQFPDVVPRFSPSGATQGAIDFLTNNPSDANIKFFNEKFGKGAAESILGR